MDNKSFTPPIIESMSQTPITFLTTERIGVDDTVNPPKNGEAYNMIVRYPYTGHIYIYNSAGIPSLINDNEPYIRVDEEFSVTSTDPVQNRTLTAAFANEANVRSASDSALNTAISDEKAYRIIADTELQNNIDAVSDKYSGDITALNVAINTEKTDRMAEDSSMQSSISSNTSSIATLNTKLNQEVSDRSHTDDELRASISSLSSSLSTEVEERTSESATMKLDIANNTAAMSSFSSGLTTEAQDRASADSELSTSINTLSGELSSEVTSRQAADSVMSSDIQENANDISTLQSGLSSEVSSREAADNSLRQDITALQTSSTTYGEQIATLSSDLSDEISNRGDADSSIENKLDKVVLTNVTIDATPSTDVVNLSNSKVNIGSGDTSSAEVPLPVASGTQAGILNSATFQAIQDNTSNINAILHSSVSVTGIPSNPTQEQLTEAYKTATGQTTVVNTARMYDVDNNGIVWVYYSNSQTWFTANSVEVVSNINPFTNTAFGSIKGSETDGQIFAESDGTGSLVGWDSIRSDVNNLLTGITGKQDTLTSEQLSAVNSGITSAKVSTYDGYASQIAAKANSADLAAVATTGSYSSLSDTPAAPGNGTLTIKVNNSSVGTFGANSGEDVTASITVPTTTSQLTNNSNFVSDASYVHTDNNFTGALKTKLEGIATGAEVNVIDNISVNSVAQTVSSKGVNITVPTTTSQLTNNSNFVSDASYVHTDNNFTTTLKNKLEGIESGANVNDIETISVNGTTQSISDKNVNITVPTTTSQLTNNSSFVSDSSYVHTDNNFTSALKTKLEGISAGAEVNAISSISVNGTAQTITSKSVNITVPTTTSQLTNNSNFVADSSYVHTDNNFTTTLKNKLDNIAAGAQVNVLESVSVNGNVQAITSKGVDISVPTITVTDTDPGEGVALAANSFIMVYDSE